MQRVQLQNSSTSSINAFLSDAMRPWRVRVFFAHTASLCLGIVTGGLGLLVGPAMQALFSPTASKIPWNDVLGPNLAAVFAASLPDGGFDPSAFFPVLPVLLMAVATVKAILGFFQWYSWEWLAEQMAWRWRRTMAECFLATDSARRDDGGITEVESELGGLISQDIRSLREFIVHYYGGLPREGLQVVFTALALLLLSPKLFGIFVFCIAPIGALLSRVGKKLRRRAGRALADNSILAEWVQQRLLGIETIKHYGTEGFESSEMKGASHNLFGKFLAAARLKAQTSPMIELFGVAAMSVALWIAFADIAQGSMSGSVVMSFFSSLALFAQAAAKLGRYFNSNREGAAAAERVMAATGILRQNAQNTEKKRELLDGAINRLSLQNVTVQYDGRTTPALKSVSQDFVGGRVYCIVGASGAGKSTFFSALLGLRPLSSGRMEWQVRESFRQSQLDVVSMPQQLQLVPTTLAANVSYPFFDGDELKIKVALERAQFRLSPERLPQGLQTRVGADALQMSGGQAQRLQLARILYHEAPFVLVDEGTSALDPVTEAEVLRSLRDVAATGACVIMVAHRRAAAEASDEIIVLSEGSVVAHGSPQKILESAAAQGVFGH